MKQSTVGQRSAWFLIGVVLLSICALIWLVLILALIEEPRDIGSTLLGGVLITIIPTGIGIYSIRRGKTQKWAIRDVRDSGSEIVIEMPWWFVLVAWFCLLLLPVGIWMLGMTTKVVFDKPLGYITVTRGHIPIFLWFLRKRVISREEARSVSVRSVQRMAGQYGETATAYEVRVAMTSGKEVKLYDGGWKRDKASYLAKRILDFAQEAEVELSPGAKFSMRVDEAFQATFATGALGMVVGGTVEQGTIRNRDEVEIRGNRSTKRAKVFEVDTLDGPAGAGESIRLLIEGLTEDDVRWGDIVEKS